MYITPCAGHTESEVITLATRSEQTNPETITVHVGSIGGIVKSVILNGDRSVSAALAAAGFPADSEVRVGGENFKGEDLLEEGDTAIVLAGEKVKGGSKE